MSAFRRLFRHPPRGSADVGRAVDEELAFHLEEMEEELEAEGLSPAEARERARSRFGELEATRAYCVRQQARRETREGWSMRIDELGQDLTWAFRTLKRSPGYAAVVVLTLAMGIAAGTVVFSLMNPYFFRPLPFGDPEELVQLGLVDPRYDWDGARLSRRMVEDYQARSASLESVGLYYYGHTNVTGPEGPERLQLGWLSENMFAVLDADAALGRTFAPGEGGPGGADVVVVDWGLWLRRWAGDPGILGRAIALDGVPHTVIGVMPRDFSFPFGGVKLWAPLGSSASSEARDDAHYLPVARLATGWTAEAAGAELTRIHADLAARHPDVDGVYAGVSVKPIREALNFAWDVLRAGLTILLVAVLFVLAIACVNVASLTLARARVRAREVAVRAAIGAGRGRIVRQLLTESLVLAALGGGLGVLVAYGLVGGVAPFVPEDLYRVGEVSVDARVLAFTAAVTLLTPLLFGLTPALRTARAELSAVLQEGGHRGGAGGGGRGRRVLVVTELALAVVLVTGTGLMLRSFAKVRQVDLGFSADRVLTVEVTPPASDYPDRDEYVAYFERTAAELRALPGVEAVGQVYPLPMNHETLPLPFSPPGSAPADPTDWPSALWASVTPDYFGAMGIPLLAGRTFDGTDTPDGPRTVVVSRTLADRYLPGGNAVGRSLSLSMADSVAAATVVGVVGAVVHSGFEAPGEDLHIYQPQSQNPRRRRFLVVRTVGDPHALTAAARDVLASVDPDLPGAVRPMEDIVLESTYPWGVGSLFLGVFGLVAVLLASLGVYGLVSYSVAQRRRELGVRVALGARTRDIRGLVLSDGLRLAVLGGGVGILAALGLAPLIRSFLFGVSAFDPGILGGAAVLFGLVALGASLIPAWRATRVDPVEVLRAE